MMNTPGRCTAGVKGFFGAVLKTRICHRLAGVAGRVVVFLCLAMVAGAGEDGTPDPRWTKPGPITPPRQNAHSHTGRRNELVIGEVETIGQDTVVFRPDADGVPKPNNLQVGDEIRVGDRIVAGPESAMEMTLGLNARMRLGPGTVMRVLDKVVFPTMKEDVTVTQRSMELKDGEARVRVQANVLTPSPVLMISGDAQIVLSRSDAVLNRNDTAQRSRVMVLDGKADVKVRTRGPDGLEKIQSRVIASAQKMDVDDGTLDALPNAVSMDAREVMKARSELGFSTEDDLRRRPPPPRHNEEMEGP